MSGEWHPTPAERLLAMLADEAALETLPAEEVHADLSAVGADPARCVAFARALAGGAGSPGGKLLGAIDLAEEAEDEIARLEKADIDEVRARIPGGSAAAIAAAARRRAGADSNVVAMKPRRSRLLRWGGPVAGIAASVLVVAVVALQYLNPARHTASFEVDSYATAPRAQAPAESATRADEPARRFARNTPPAEDKSRRALAPDTGATSDRLAKQERREAEAPAAVPAAPPPGLAGNLNEGPVLDDRADDDLRARSSAAEPEGAGAVAEELAAKPDAKTAPAGVAGTVSAMVIVDTSQVPLAVQSQAVPQPDLVARIDEARRLAGNRPVIALYRVAGPAGRRDYAQVPLESAMTQQMAAPAPLSQLLGTAATEYDFLALPPE